MTRDSAIDGATGKDGRKKEWAGMCAPCMPGTGCSDPHRDMPFLRRVCRQARRIT